MIRTEHIGDATLYLADCREVLPTLSGIDAVVTDPPYGIRFSEYASHDDDPAAYEALIKEFVPAAEALVSDGWMVVFMGAPRAHEWQSLLARQWRVMACAKNFTQILPGIGPLWSCDFALFWPIGKPKQRGKRRDFHLAITSDMRTRPKGHPCPRPLDQMMHVVDCFSDDWQTVLDPFMGSGTTGVACARLGRRFVGVEIEPRYFDIACRRIEEAQRQPDLFVQRAPVAARVVDDAPLLAWGAAQIAEAAE
jgi:DNA modification methylase